jgi:anti-anti-sigma factor
VSHERARTTTGPARERLPELRGDHQGGFTLGVASTVPDIPGVPPFAVEVTYPRPGVVVLSVHGELDMLTTWPLEEHLDEQLPAATERLVLDLTEVSFLGTSALGALVRTHRGLPPGRQLRLVCSPVALNALQMTALDTLLHIDSSLSEALDDA